MKKQLSQAWSKMIEKLDGWLDALITNLPNLLIAVVVFVAAFFISRYVNTLMKKALTKTSMQDSIKNMIAKVTSVVVILAGLFLALGILNLNKVLTSLLAGAGVAGLAIGLALQGALSNTFSGIVLSFIKHIKMGDWISSNGYSGEVVDITLRSTTLKEVDNNLVAIPNKMVVENPIKNFSVTEQSRVILSCGVAYNSDLEKVESLLRRTIIDNFDSVETEEDVLFFFTEFGDSAITFETRFFINSTSGLEVKKAKSKAIIKIKKAFDEHGINIPFPMRTIDFGNQLKITSDKDEMSFHAN
ncbi:mechanosensitive ion channel family protein [Flavobacteriaceae bacterium M23B6Z8]